MRRLWPVILGTLFGAVALAEQTLINGVAVIVNDAIITYQDVRLLVRGPMELAERQYGNQPLVLEQKRKELQADGIEMLVDNKLILHDFKTTGYNLPESYIDDMIKERIKQRYGDRATMIKSLREEGWNFEDERQRVRDEFIIEQMRYLHVSKEVLISPQKILNFYEANKTNYAVADQVKLRMIMLRKPSSDNGAVKQLAEEILNKVKEGASFEEMAGIHSDGAERASSGDRGWVERTALRKELADVAFSLQKGQRSGVIDLPEACFLMQVEDVRQAHVKPLTEVREDIEKNLLAQERARAQKKWLDRLRAKSFVRYF
ncbi:MAG: peptidylprolyl isomerase [Verrucomicrobia bacterium]|nr:peptidylprolyl isomerase [Verrucomicrobiota bacterium]